MTGRATSVVVAGRAQHPPHDSSRSSGMSVAARYATGAREPTAASPAASPCTGPSPSRGPRRPRRRRQLGSACAGARTTMTGPSTARADTPHMCARSVVAPQLQRRLRPPHPRRPPARQDDPGGRAHVTGPPARAASSTRGSSRCRARLMRTIRAAAVHAARASSPPAAASPVAARLPVRATSDARSATSAAAAPAPAARPRRRTAHPPGAPPARGRRPPAAAPRARARRTCGRDRRARAPRPAAPRTRAITSSIRAWTSARSARATRHAGRQLDEPRRQRHRPRARGPRRRRRRRRGELVEELAERALLAAHRRQSSRRRTRVPPASELSESRLVPLPPTATARLDMARTTVSSLESRARRTRLRAGLIRSGAGPDRFLRRASEVAVPSQRPRVDEGPWRPLRRRHRRAARCRAIACGRSSSGSP